MAIKVGAEDKRKVAIFGVLLCVLLAVAIWQFTAGESTPTPLPAAPKPVPVQPSARPAPNRALPPPPAASGPDAKKLPNSGLDPALHLEKLAASESIEYAGDGRNIFSADSIPVRIDPPVAPARPPDIAAQNQPPVYVPPQPPQIDLHYFGYTASRDGKREAFLSHGDDIYEAAAGEVVNHRYKILAVDVRSVQVTDLNYNNTQTLQLLAN